MQQKIKDLHNGIGTEVIISDVTSSAVHCLRVALPSQAAQLRTQIESQKVESIKYLAGRPQGNRQTELLGNSP